MKNSFFKRFLALTLTLCMVLSMCPVSVFAADADEKTPVCDKIEHTHSEACDTLNCPHEHTDDCYSKTWDICNHVDCKNDKQTGESLFAKVTDILSFIKAATKALALYQDAYNAAKETDECKAVGDKAYKDAWFMKEAAKELAIADFCNKAGLAALKAETYCCTVSEQPDICEHKHNTDCYAVACGLDVHAHDGTCYTYTITWVDEDGTVLETDTDVAYGATPSYDGEEPTKADTDTAKYTFAGWTPDVVTVTEDATYTATYTTKNVYTVAFVIGEETFKTSTVVEGETVSPPEITKEYYTLSAWTLDGAEYNFETPVTGNITLNASWSPINDENNNGIADEEEVSTVKVVASNATVTINRVAATEASVAAGEEVTIVITPNSKYAVESVTLDGEAMEVAYSKGKATVSFTANFDTDYVVEAETVASFLELQNATMNVYGAKTGEAVFNAVYVDSCPELTAEDVKVEYLAFAYKGKLTGKITEFWFTPETDVLLQDIIGNLNLSSLMTITTELHNFGTQETETVRVTFNGNEQYATKLQETATVTFVDSRVESQVNLKEGVSVTYGATEAEILEAVFVSVTSGETVIANPDVTLSISSLNAGTQTVTVSFAGNDTYKPSSAQVEVTITKANTTIDVESATVHFGTIGDGYNVDNMITVGAADADYVTIAAGIGLGNNAAEDANVVVYVDLPMLVSLDSLPEGFIRETAQKLLDAALKEVNGVEIPLGQLSSTLNDLLGSLESLEDMGVDLNMDSTTIDMVMTALSYIETLDGVGNLTIVLSMGQGIAVRDAGAYLVGAVVADANYNPAFDMNYLVITPDGYKAVLGWKHTDDNGIFLTETLKNIDLGAYVVSVEEGTVEEANTYVMNLFFGVDTDGNTIMTQDQSELGVGVYTEIALLTDVGNTMYYAEPIVREFAVVTGVVDVVFIDENGDVNNDRVFTYDGEGHGMKAYAFERGTTEYKIENALGEATVRYLGVATSGTVYNSDKAPTDVGAYTVLATYADAKQITIGAAVGALAITPAESKLDMLDVTLCPDNYTVEDLYTVTPAGLHVFTVIVDKDNNVNVILPELPGIDAVETFTIPLGDQKACMKDIFNKLPAEAKAALIAAYAGSKLDLPAELQAIIDELENVGNVTVNGALPTELGTYKTYGLTFGRNYGVSTDSGVLTLAHTPSDEAAIENLVEASCITDGSFDSVIYCSVCGEELSREANVIPSGGHVAGDIVIENEVAATHTTKGSYDEVVYCTICGDELSRETIYTDKLEGYLVIFTPGDGNGAIAPGKTVYVDGEAYVLDEDCTIVLDEATAKIATSYVYNKDASKSKYPGHNYDVYPTNMYVWELRMNDEEVINAIRVTGMDNILQYNGTSIRISGSANSNGIRVLSGVPTKAKKALISGSMFGKDSVLAGYTLKEYGTIASWSSKVENPTLGATGTGSAAAYKKGSMDKVFSTSGSVTVYANTLTPLRDKYINKDLMIRPYMILVNDAGETITIYGGTVQRSIGYVAYQNRATYTPGTANSKYVWSIITKAGGVDAFK